MGEVLQCVNGKAEVRLFRGTNSNMYIISYLKENKSILVDCGLPWDIPNLLEFIEKNSLPPIEKVVCTHFHVDHCAGWIELRKTVKLPRIYFHKEGAPVVSGEKSMEFPAFRDFKDIMLPVMQEYQYTPELKEAIKTLFFGTTFKSRFPMRRVSFFDSNEEVVPGFKTIHTPGHRPESVSFYDPDSGVFISGDFIIVMKGRVVVNTFVYNAKKQMESVEKVKKLDNLIYLLPGHGPIVHFNERLLRYKV
ncbi:MAG: MBL fold metallo-hydrolase [bacterium]